MRRLRRGEKRMRAIVLEGFGGPEHLVYRDLPEPDPVVGQVVIKEKAFGLNHAELHMRRGEWAEAAQVIGIECVGLVEACPGGEFPIGAKVAALMGGLGRTINGSYAEYTRVQASNVALIESDLPWAELAAIPETYATAWTCLFRNLEIVRGQTLVIRGAASSFGQAALTMAVDAGVRVIATTRSRARVALLEQLGAARRHGGAGAFDTDRGSQAARCGARSGRQQHHPRFPRHAPPGRSRLPGGLAGRPRADCRLQSAGADGQRRLPHVLRQLRVRHAAVPAVRCAAAADCRPGGGWASPGKAKPGLPL